MPHQDTIFATLLKAVPRHRFDGLVERHGADRRVRTLSCWTQFVALVYAQLAGAQSLREIEAALASHGNLLYHLGAQPVRRSTLSDANRLRPVGLYVELFDLLLGRLQANRAARELVRLVDATSLRLSETLHSWASFCAGYAGAKLHVVYDPQADCPTFFAITPAKINDIVIAKAMPIEAGTTYVFDLGYCCFAWWAKLDAAGCRFVTRLKTTSPVRVLAQRPADGRIIRSDRIVRLNDRMARHRKNPCDSPLREIVVAVDSQRCLRLVTNDLDAPATDIAELYKQRWQIELFFRWVKQNLKIKRFLGTSENAVRLQIIVALIAYLLIRLAHHWPRLPLSLQGLARLLRANLMHRKPFAWLLAPPPVPPHSNSQQLTLAFAHAKA